MEEASTGGAGTLPPSAILVADCQIRGATTTRLALFDLGRTLVRGDPAMMFARYLREHGRFPDASWERLDAAVRAYHGGGDPDLAVDGANEAFASGFAGMSPARLEALAREKVLAGGDADYYAYTRPLLAAVGALGYRKVGVTGVADPLASVIGSALGLDEMYATALGVDADGRLTGRTLFENRAGWKLERVRRLLAQAGPDLDACLAFGDSGADLPLLLAVGRPVIVNAREPLLSEVAALGWPMFGEADDIAARLPALLAAPAWNARAREP